MQSSHAKQAVAAGTTGTTPRTFLYQAEAGDGPIAKFPSTACGDDARQASATTLQLNGSRGRRRPRPCQLLRPSLLMAYLLPGTARGFAFCARAPLTASGVLTGRGAAQATWVAASAPPMMIRLFPLADRVRRLLALPVAPPASSVLKSSAMAPALRNSNSRCCRGTNSKSSLSSTVSATAPRAAAHDKLDACTSAYSATTAPAAVAVAAGPNSNRTLLLPLVERWRRRWSAVRSAAASVRRVGSPVCTGQGEEELAAPVLLPVPSRRRGCVTGVALLSVMAFVALQRPAVAATIGSVVGRRGGSLLAMMPSPAIAGKEGVVRGAEMSLETVAPKLALWFTLFVTSAAFHSAEIAITTLYPWKVKEFAEEEGENSPFQVLNKDITRVLTTILVATTVCTIYNAALFTNVAIQMFGSAGLAYATAALTITTLFFGELLPKALGVNNAEVVARRILPIIIVLSWALNPVAKSFTILSKLMLSMLGFKSTETGRVSEEELRLIVTGAKQSGGIESQEGMMIEGVLDLQDTKIHEIMRPRVEVVAIEANSTMMDLYALHKDTKYSRIPVYSGEIDRISGVVLSKDLLQYVQDPGKLSSVLVADAMESTYFVPETMSVWNVLEEVQ